MLSSMTPTMVLNNGELTMITGSPGGTTIMSSVYESILNALVFNMSAQETADSPRFHHQLLPKDQIRYHPGLAPEVLAQLEKMGYVLNESRFGDLQLIIKKDGKVDAASESSGRGKALVF
jgi:gamma-glutamyltranspeptidase / glutathione hydrolase